MWRPKNGLAALATSGDRDLVAARAPAIQDCAPAHPGRATHCEFWRWNPAVQSPSAPPARHGTFLGADEEGRWAPAPRSGHPYAWPS